MLFRRRSKRINKHHQSWLYSAVYAGRFSVLAVFLLLLSFLVQPVNQAFASEPPPPEPPPPVAEDVQPQEDSPPVIEESPPESPPETVSETPESPSEQPGDLDVPVDESEGEEVVVDVDDSTGSVGVGDPIDSGGGSVEEDSRDLIDGESNDVAEDVPDTDVKNKRKASTTGEVLQIENLVTEDNYYQFSKQSCIEVGSGVYNCTSRTDEVDNSDSVVYADRDAAGDMEIFLKTSRGKVKQITDNDFDDTSPHYDAESMRVVWQRVIDGRSQIMLFDIMDDKEIQLTYSKTNNMEPKVSDSGIVWQAWDDNDWEIMFFDGSYTEQVTSNDVQDVAPVVQDDYVLWNVLGGEEQQARVYSLDTKETVSIQGYEGGSIVNPRFVLVYDTEYENGDVITQTFDPATGLSEPIAAKPAPEPVQIPNTDPTGEIRALIQGKTQKDEKFMKTIQTDDSGDSGAATVVEPGTLNLNASSTEAIVTPATVTVDDFELTEYDLVIPQDALENALSTSEESTQ